MQTISSRLTFFYKKIFPLLMFGLFTVFIAIGFYTNGKNGQPPLPVLIVPFLMMGFFYLIFKKLIFDLADEVLDSGDFLVFRYGNEQDQVPLSNIVNISYSCTSPPRASLMLRQPCKFGKELVFCPLIPASGFLKSMHFRNDVVDDLIRRVDEKRKV